MRIKLLALLVAHTVFQSAWAEEHLEETLVEGTRDSRTIQLADTPAVAPDSAQLLRQAPGANFNSNGPVTGIAQLRGMFGPRVGVSVNGQTIAAGGPNWMDPPLSYAPAAQLESMQIYRGIAPVSAGQETIGGAIDVKTWQGQFASDGVKTDGNIRLGAQSVNSSGLFSLAASLASENHKAKILLLSENGDDAEFAGGTISPTGYDRQRIDLGYAFKTGKHELSIDVARNDTGESGTPALPMDIGYIESDLASVNYSYSGSARLEARVYGSEIEHGMTNYESRQAPMMESMWRRNIATGENQGFLFNATIGSWKLGIDYHDELHNSNIDNINNPMFFIVNFNDASREVTGLFAEHQQQYNNGLSTEFGLRVNQVEMDAGTVDGTPANMMPPAGMLRDQFNNADRQQSDTNFDLVAKLATKQGFYAGLAQKTRSASYQERYLWLPMEATAGLADGRVYLGNIELEPEVAHELELGYDLNTSKFFASPRIFYRKVKDYIQGTPSENAAAIMMVEMMGMNPYPPLQFNNVDAVFYGFDMDASYTFNDSWNIKGIINYVRGERDDINDNLYRIAPLNATFSLNLEKPVWGLSAESVLYQGQKDVSETQGEQTTPGYGILNLRAHWKIASSLQLAGGIENALDKAYQDHLAGYNRVRGADIATGDRLYGYGRNLYLRLDYRF